MRYIVLPCLLAASLQLIGCASVSKGVNQSVSIQTEPVEGATCTLNNNKGTWYLNRTPGTVTVHRSYKDLKVSCEKKGHPSGSVEVKSKTTPAVFGNAIVGGVIGTTIDIANGAAYDYPEVIHVPMKATKKA